ncbi:lipocalin-like domain-containing protein [Microbacterium sp. No. 7]|uniref:lipocalin-like domain-containing protein n=1 Tax=Microbacterium sp. No. 7 TaxID=1714373 RepID=UPI0006D1D19D|nr:lipocalin-like domain-containing protein [Microbacterium sp. No. 7]ALJ21199.1 hypothetical protein AOA12_15330 [Microbacterium sp. No. 7]
MITAEDVHGTWRLTAVRAVDASGAPLPDPYGPVPMGRLVLRPDGRMIAMVSDGRTALPPGAVRAYASYCGNYVVEDATLKTLVDAAHLPSMVGTIAVRRLELHDGELSLLPPRQPDGRQHDLRWERAGPA